MHWLVELAITLPIAYCTSAVIQLSVCSSVHTCVNTPKYHYYWEKFTYTSTNAHLLSKGHTHIPWYELSYSIHWLVVLHSEHFTSYPPLPLS